MRRAGVVAIVAVLLLSAVAGPAVGTAGAIGEVEGKTCTEESYFLGIELLPPACSEWEPIEYEGMEGDVLQSEIYSDAGTFTQGNDEIGQLSELAATDGKPAVWSEAKVSIFENHEAGEPESVAKEEARKIVNEKMANNEKAILDRMTSMAYQLDNDFRTVKEANDTTLGGVFSSGPSYTISNYNLNNRTYTLQTGETYNWTDVDINGAPLYNEDGSVNFVTVNPVDSELDPTEIANYSNLGPMLNTIDTQASDLRQNVEQTTSDIYANYSTGELDPDDYLSASDVASQYNLASQNGTGYATAQAALLGYPTNATASMTIEFVSTGNTLTGNLFSTQDPPTTNDDGVPVWKVDHTYNVSAYNGTIYLADTDASGPSDWITVENDFKITSMQNTATGVQLNQTTVQDEVTLETDATNLSKQVQNLNAALENRSNLEDDSCGILCFGGGGGGDGTIPFVLLTLLGVLSVGALGVVGVVIAKKS